MKKKLKYIIYGLSIIILIIFSISMIILNNSTHGKEYSFIDKKIVKDEESGIDKIISTKYVFKFEDEDIMRVTMTTTGQEPVTEMCLYYISEEGYLYSTFDSSSLSYFGKIDAFKIDVFETDSVPIYFKCEKNLQLKKIYIIGIIASSLFVCSCIGYEIYTQIKKRRSKNNLTEENIEKVDI